MIPRFLSLLAVTALASCTTPLSGANEPSLVQTLAEAPPGAAPGTCWGKVVTPAVIETVTDQILIKQPDGTATQPAIYRTETRQKIVTERQVTWFETPCPSDLTPDFVSSLQRALKARSLYRGAITGEMDARTRAAVRGYQLPDGLDSGILSLAAARKLGLVAVELPEEEA